MRHLARVLFPGFMIPAFLFPGFLCLGVSLSLNLSSVPSAFSENVTAESVREFRSGTLVPGKMYRLKGYVTYRYECPPCPAGALCKPCMSDNIVFSDKKGKIKNYSALGEESVIIYTNRKIAVDFTSRAIAQVSVRTSSSQEKAIDNLELISLEPSPE